MSRSKSSIRKFKWKKLFQEIRDLPYAIRFGMQDKEYLKESDDIMGHPLGVKDFSNRGSEIKRKIHRRIRHKSKDAIRHGDPDRLFRKFNGKKGIKTGY